MLFFLYKHVWIYLNQKTNQIYIKKKKKDHNLRIHKMKTQIHKMFLKIKFKMMKAVKMKNKIV